MVELYARAPWNVGPFGGASLDYPALYLMAKETFGMTITLEILDQIQALAAVDMELLREAREGAIDGA